MVDSTVLADLPAVSRRRTRVIGYLHSARARQKLRLDYGGTLDEVKAMPRPSGPDGVCRSPLLAWDAEKNCPVLWRCGSHRSTQCPACAATYKRRVRRVVQTGVLDRVAAGGYLALVTFTAPGTTAGHLRWSVTGPKGKRPVCGCERSAQHGMGVWNSDAGNRWNHLRTLLAREYPGMSYYRAAEAQKRGALHHHVILWTKEPLDPQRIQKLAMAAGYGCTVDVSVCKGQADAQRFVNYVTKYVTKSTDDRGDLPWSIRDVLSGRVSRSRPTFRTWSQSVTFGCTMKSHLDAIAAERRRYFDSLPTGEELVASMLGGVVLSEAVP